MYITMKSFLFGQKRETANVENKTENFPSPHAENVVQTRPVSALAIAAGSSMGNKPDNHVFLRGIYEHHSVAYSQVTWEWMEEAVSPKQIHHIEILQNNNDEPNIIETKNDLDGFKKVVSKASQIEWISAVLKEEPPNASDLQRRVALAVCQAAYEENRNSAQSLGTKMSQLGIDTLHKGTVDSYSTEYVVAECRKYNEVYVGFRGTKGIDEWLSNAKAFVTQEHTLGGVHAGFYDHMQVVDVNLLHSLLDSGKKVILCGHSLGAAAAAIRLICMLPRLHRSGQILKGQIRVIGFGAPLFVASACAKYVMETYNVRNLFDFIVISGDPVPGLLADLSCLVDQVTNPRNKSANVDFVLDVAHHISPSMTKAFSNWFTWHGMQLKKALKGVKCMYEPIGIFHFICSSKSMDTVYEPKKISQQLKGFELNPSSVLKHQIESYVAIVEQVLDDPSRRKGMGKIAPLINPEIGSYNIELGDFDLWIKMEDCPLHISKVVLTAIGQKDYSFKIKDTHREEVEYRTTKDDGVDVPCKPISSSTNPTMVPSKLSKMTLKLPVTPRQRETIREIFKDEGARIKFVTAIGRSTEPLPTGIRSGNGDGQNRLLVGDILRIYHGVLLSILLEVVHNRTTAARRAILHRGEPVPFLKEVSVSAKEILGSKYIAQTDISQFLDEVMQLSTNTDEKLKAALDKAEKVASDETEMLGRVFEEGTLLQTILTSADIAKGVAAAVVIATVVAGCIAGAAVLGGISLVAVPVYVGGSVALAEGGICAIVGGAAVGLASMPAFLRSDKIRETLYVEKLKLILKTYKCSLPTQLTSTKLEEALNRLIEEGGMKDPEHNGRPLTTKSEATMSALAHSFAKLKCIREYAEKRTVVTLVGVKNAGKSTAGKVLFKKEMHGGVNRSTEFPQPYSWESADRLATVIDFPGATEAKDETLKLAERYLYIGGASAWCLAFVNPFSMGTADCKLVKDVADRFHPSRVRIVCTHCDARDIDRRFKVDNFKDEISGTTGVNGVKKYVVNMFDGPKIGIDTDKVIVCSFQVGSNELPNGVLNQDDARNILLGQIWPM